MWRGPRTNTISAGDEKYYTCESLSKKIASLARDVSTQDSIFLDVGVGEGALFKHLPEERRVGVEVCEEGCSFSRWKDVFYGTDFMTWNPNSRFDKKHVVVVCNPPFSLCIPIMNRCSSLFSSLTVVWIIGLGMRLWTNEDRIDTSMHLVNEWLTPPEWNEFEVNGQGKRVIRTAVQVWKKTDSIQRQLWSSIPFSMKGRLRIDNQSGCLVVSRMNGLKQLGRAGILGEDVVVKDGRAFLTVTGKKKVDASTPFDSKPCQSMSLGTLSYKGGTAFMIWSECDPHILLHKVHERRKDGVFCDLLRFRNSSGMSVDCGFCTVGIKLLEWILSDNWKKMKRDIQYLDIVRRCENQY